MRQHLEELEQREKVESMTDAEPVTHRAYKDERAAGTLRVVNTTPPMPEASGDPA